MDTKSLTLLEFPLIRERLEAATQFAPSRRLAAALEPSRDPVVVARRLDETDEARALQEERPGVGIGGARDVGAAVERAARSGRLDAGQLVEVMVTLAAAAGVSAALAEERRPLLRALGRRIQPVPNLRLRLEASFDPAAELLDTASPPLGGLRRAVRVAYERLRARLEQLVHGSELASSLQEPIITLRNGRYVIPVRADARGRVKGIVHDQSGSGQTLFIEPLVVVELGNAWRETQLAVQAEEERILDDLSALVGTHAATLHETLAALADFDFWMAKARLAGEMDGARATTATEPVVELRGARHPGLSGLVVPIDVRLGGEFTALVITGPNTGGKTVALRTLGLLSLMHQAGLHVPAAPGSRLPIFGDIFADIGDEQSVAQSLSTFSGHLRSIVRIVAAAGPGCLVLLDELGAGTDPTEGSALAQALLDHFIRAGALVAATTHYAELKTYAHNTPGARNASVEFDLETLSPTYRLTIGLPGTSQAFAIAERLGLPAPLVADARARLTRAQVEFEATLASIRVARDSADAAVERAREAEVRAAEARQTAELERARARRERDDSFVSARAEAERALAAVREEIRTARAALERGALSEPGLDVLAGDLDRRLAAMPGTRGRPPRATSEAVAAPIWRVGMRARSSGGGWEGRIAAIERDGRRATLEVGGMRVAVDVPDLVAATIVPASRTGGSAGGPDAAGAPRTGRRGAIEAGAATSKGPASPMPSTLDLRGATVQEALEALDHYLDGVSLAGIGRVTIIHGHGSGALRDAVRELLAGHALVGDWRPGGRGEGGDGTSVVTL
jgi:DNA mismatch repair protein MutS2